MEVSQHHQLRHPRPQGPRMNTLPRAAAVFGAAALLVTGCTTGPTASPTNGNGGSPTASPGSPVVGSATQVTTPPAPPAASWLRLSGATVADPPAVLAAAAALTKDVQPPGPWDANPGRCVFAGPAATARPFVLCGPYVPEGGEGTKNPVMFRIPVVGVDADGGVKLNATKAALVQEPGPYLDGAGKPVTVTPVDPTVFGESGPAGYMLWWPAPTGNPKSTSRSGGYTITWGGTAKSAGADESLRVAAPGTAWVFFTVTRDASVKTWPQMVLSAGGKTWQFAPTSTSDTKIELAAIVPGTGHGVALTAGGKQIAVSP